MTLLYSINNYSHHKQLLFHFKRSNLFTLEYKFKMLTEQAVHQADFKLIEWRLPTVVSSVVDFADKTSLLLISIT